MTENTPDAVKIGRETAQDLMGRESFRRQIVAQGWVFAVRMAAEVGARAMQAAMPAPEGVREDYAAICKELGCIEKPGVPLRFIQEMRKNLAAAGERIDWLLRSWDDATITERQELDRMRRGWGPTTPTERMLRHRDLRDCMQALSGALTDLTTPEDDNAEPEVEARLQEAYDRVNKRYLASLEILRRLDEPLERPDLDPAGAREVRPMRRDWVKCPICREPDMRRETDEDGASLVFCTNHMCPSNDTRPTTPSRAREGAEDQQPSGAVWGRAAREASAQAPDMLVDAVNAELAKRKPTPALVISEETINTVRAHAIHNAAQGGMPQAEAEDHFGTPTPAGAGDLVERARNAERNITGRLRDAGWAPTRAGIESARNHIRDLASRIEALEAEVARQKARADDMHRRAQQAEAPKMAARDVAKVMWRFISKAHDRYYQQKARATTAEAERDALKAEVERKDKALVGAFEFAGRARGTALGLAMSGKDNPKLDSSLMKMHEDGLEVERTIRAALAPAKAGG